jgi:hypothetical protein
MPDRRRDSDIRFGLEEGTVEEGFQRLFREGVAKPSVVSPFTDGVPLFDNDSIRRFLGRTDQLSPQSFPGKVGPDDIPSSLANAGTAGDPLSQNDNINGILTFNSRIASAQARKLEIQSIALAGIDRNPAVRAADVELGVLTMQQLALQPNDEFGQNQLAAKIQQAQQNRELALGLATEAANRDVALKSFDLDKQIIQDKARIENLKILQGEAAKERITIPGKMADQIMAGYGVTSRVEANIIANGQTRAQKAWWFESAGNPPGVYSDWSDPGRMTDADNYTEYVVNSAPPELRDRVREHLARTDTALVNISAQAQAEIEQEAAKFKGDTASKWADPDFVRGEFLSRRKKLFDEAVVTAWHKRVMTAPPGSLVEGDFDSGEEYQLARVIQDKMDPQAPNAETAMLDVLALLPPTVDSGLVKGAVANLIKAHRVAFNETNRYSGTLMDIQTTRSISDNIIMNLDKNKVDAARMSAIEQLQQNALAIPVPGQADTFQLPPTRSALGVPVPHPRSPDRFAPGVLESGRRVGRGAGGGGGGGLPSEVQTFLRTFTTGATNAALQGIEDIGVAVTSGVEDIRAIGVATGKATFEQLSAAGKTAGEIADTLGISPSAVRERLEQEERDRQFVTPGIRG